MEFSAKRRSRRTPTAETYRPQRWGRKWQPGQEPGIPAAALHGPKRECDITVVDFSQDDIQIRHLDNDSLRTSLEIPREDWVVCRWINVNGISGDVIQLLASYKNFHRLAIEDMLNNHNRTKADWGKKKGLMQRLAKLIYPEKSPKTPLQPVARSVDTDNSGSGFVTGNGHVPVEKVAIPTRTLQRYHGGPNEERTEYMEKKSALANKGLAVSVEQVSIFMTSDNCLVSFFESSAADVEMPIVGRLQSRETLLRKSTDASMILQAIIDTIIDLAIQVTTGYQDAVDELELNVLTGKLQPHSF
ncbi:MAG: hypothetical protein Q9187_003919 [Circinaria calcarea]